MRKVIKTILVILIILVVAAFTIKYCNERANEKAEQERLERIETTKQLAIQTKIRIKNVEAQLKSIPASKVALNLRLYKELHELDPDNPRYADKIIYYQIKVKEKEVERKRREARGKTEVSKQRQTQAVSLVSFEDIRDNMNRMTTLTWKEYVKALEGQHVSWTGWVVDVKEQWFGGYKILIDMDPPDTLFSVQDVYIEDLPLSHVSQFSKDDKVSFSGKITSVIDVLGVCSITIKP